MPLLYSLFAFIFGTITGSFLNVVILRLPEGKSLNGRSMCAACSHYLGVFDLFPVASYLLLRGRCRYCNAKFSSRYLAIELITGALFMFCYLSLMPDTGISILQLISWWVIIAVLVVVFVVDFEHYIILDQVILTGSIAVVVLNLIFDVAAKSPAWNFHSHLFSGIIGAVSLVVPFFLIWYFSQGAWLGFGDVKLAVFLGLALGWPMVLVSFMVAVLSGGVISSILLLNGKKGLKSQIPFGTFLSLGAVLVLFYGQQVLDWYLAILGF